MKSLAKPVRDGGAEGRTGDWGEVVTRYPYENVGMDHLLSMEFITNRNNRMKPSGIAQFIVKRFHESYLFRLFYLVLREYFSQILFFEN